jgi:Tfp pilus assembly protein PilO
MSLTLINLGEFLKRYPIGVACGLLSVAALAGYYVRSGRSVELGSQLKEVEAQAQKILNNVHNATNLVEQYSAMTKATKELDSRLVRGSERARNQQYFYQIESETGVKEISLRQNNVGTAKKGASRVYGGIGFAISVEGNYRQILDFVGRLESGRHFYRLVSATLIRRTERDASGTGFLLNLTLNLELLGLP